jgi:hypothetical protein
LRNPRASHIVRVLTSFAFAITEDVTIAKPEGSPLGSGRRPGTLLRGRITISGTANVTVRTADSIGVRAESDEFWRPRIDHRPKTRRRRDDSA